MTTIAALLCAQQHEITITRTRAQLDEPAFRAAYARGYAMTLAQAFDYARSSID